MGFAGLASLYLLCPLVPLPGVGVKSVLQCRRGGTDGPPNPWLPDAIPLCYITGTYALNQNGFLRNTPHPVNLIFR